MDNNFDEALKPVTVVEDEYPVATEDYVELTTDDVSLGEKIAKIAIASLSAVLTVIGGLTVVKWIRNKIKARKAKKEAAPVEVKTENKPVVQDAEKKEETPATGTGTEAKPEK